jgi:hypothetical protein
MKIRHFLTLGSGIPMVFFATTIICGFVLGHYNHFSRMVSELGALGTRSQYIFSAGLLLCSALSVLFVIELTRACRATGISAVPAAVILFYSFSIAGAALFPLPLRLHLIMGIPSILLIASPLTGLFLWRGPGKPGGLAIMATVSFLLMGLGFLTYFPEVLSAFPGLKQRFFHLGWSIWFFYLGFGFNRRLEIEKK